MLLFVLGYGAVQLAVVAIALAANSAPDELPPGTVPMLVLTLLAVPVGAAWLCGAVIYSATPRRLFDSRVGRPLARALLGMAGAGGAILPTTLAVSALPDYVPDAVATGVCAGMASAICIMLLPRRRPGICVHCGYDLHGLPDRAACPECGAHGSG